MGEASRRGTFEQRRQQAINEGRVKLSNNKFGIGSQQQQPLFDPKEAIEQLCKGCGGVQFEKVCKVFRVPKLAPSNRTGQDLTLEVPVAYFCWACGLEFGKEPVAKGGISEGGPYHFANQDEVVIPR